MCAAHDCFSAARHFTTDQQRTRKQENAMTRFLESTKQVLAFAAAAFLVCGASAQSPTKSGVAPYPNRPVQIIVPFTPGTGMDILARTVGQKLSERWGQPVIVDNRPGASGNIGTDMVVKAAPDGYTLLITANTLVMTVSLYRNVPYDPIRDLAPIEKMAVGTMALTLNPAVPAHTLKEFVAYAKANPGKLAYGSPGIGTPQHLATELLKLTAGIDMLHVPYKGSAGAITGLLSGDVAMMSNALHAVLPQVKAGKINAIAVGGPKRSRAAPEIPTFAESGYPDFDVDFWYGLLAPAATPREIIAKLNQDVAEILNTPEMREVLTNQGLEPVTGTPEEFGALMRTDLARWASVIKTAGIAGE
jgi:tripartite-type tricarboxylate transporter receptor subunit TctC